jgi:hypothetical protein
MSKKWFVFVPAVLAAAAILFVGADRAFGQKEGSAEQEKLSAEQRIEKALNEPTTLEFTETPLSDVVDYLKSLHGIEIQIDRKALDDVGIDTQTPVTRNLTGVSLRSALNLMLRDLNLTYIVENEVLLITTPDASEERFTTRVYPVGDLVVYRDEAGQRWEDYGPLIEAIESSIVPAGSHDGPTGRISGGTFGAAKVLVVTEPYEVHRHIAKLLEEIRELARQNPSEEPPLRSRHGMGRNVPGMMGPGTQTPGMAAPRVKTQMKTDKQSGTVMPGTAPGMGVPGLMGPGTGAPATAAPGMGTPRKPAVKPRPAEQDDPFRD